MSPWGGGTTRGAGFPRVSGDEPALELRVVGDAKFSPRERG